MPGLPRQSVYSSALEHMGEVEHSAGDSPVPFTSKHLPAPWSPNGSAAAFGSSVLFFKGKATSANVVPEGSSFPASGPAPAAALQLEDANWEMHLKRLKFCLSII